ncbi:MAG: glutathione S-transferase N-terminal domain-containing protein [Gammaproteobacteria bacterium]|nr:glutathione S-transferase N-terminal domain-containing protein [Gammaproteobacteria bacterium]
MGQQPSRRQAMTFFSVENSPRCHMVRLVLAEKNISHDLVLVNQEDTPEELKEINPYNETPTLVDRDLVLYDYRVIVEYLDERFPHPPLMPVDPVSRSRHRLMLYRVERDWYSLVDIIGRGDKSRDAARKAFRDSLLETATIFDQKPFFLSDEFSLIDCALAPLLWRLPDYAIELPSVARTLVKYSERIFSRAAFRASLTEKEKDLRPTG